MGEKKVECSWWQLLRRFDVSSALPLKPLTLLYASTPFVFATDVEGGGCMTEGGGCVRVCGCRWGCVGEHERGGEMKRSGHNKWNRLKVNLFDKL